MANRIFIGVPMYGPVFPRFYQNYMVFVGRAARAMHSAGFTESVPILTTTMPYVEVADSNIVQSALRRDDWDYLMLVEQDNIVPDDWVDVVVNQLDPAVHHVVGRWYFGKAQEDQRSICGYIRPNGDFDRFSYEQVQAFRAKPDLYRVGAGMEGVDDSALTFSVGLGCTAISRVVLEDWNGRMPWFQTISSWNDVTGRAGYLGQDIGFCVEAARQGFHVYVDTRKASGHIGEFVSDDETYTASAQYMASRGAANLQTSETISQVGIATAMSEAELNRLNEIAKGKVVLEIGSRYGASTIGMAGTGAEIIYAIDWHRGDAWHEAAGAAGESLTQFWLNVGYYKLRDKIVPLVGTSAQILPMLPDQRFDLIFIDADHSYNGVKFDLEHALRLLKPDGVIAFHDYEREYPTLSTDLELGVSRAANELIGQPSEVVDTLAIYRSPVRQPIAA